MSKSRKKADTTEVATATPTASTKTEATKASASKKVTSLKIKGVKEPVTVTKTVDKGTALHHYFQHPDDEPGKNRRVIRLKTRGVIVE